MAEAGDDPENMAKAQALFNQLQAMKDEAQAIAQKISELDQERHEHSLVAETLEKIDGERKCFRCGCATLRALRCGRIERPVCVLTIEIGGSSAHARSQALASARKRSQAHGRTARRNQGVGIRKGCSTGLASRTHSVLTVTFAPPTCVVSLLYFPFLHTLSLPISPALMQNDWGGFDRAHSRHGIAGCQTKHGEAGGEHCTMPRSRCMHTRAWNCMCMFFQQWNAR